MAPAIGQLWMVEIVCRIAIHSKTFHDPYGSDVFRNSHGDDRIQANPFEAEGDAGSSSFCRIAFPPVLPCQPPADFHAWREVSLKRRDGKPDESDEWRVADRFNGPKPEAVALEVSFNTIDQRVAFSARQDGGEMAHYPRIAVQLGERVPVGHGPAP